MNYSYINLYAYRCDTDTGHTILIKTFLFRVKPPRPPLFGEGERRNESPSHFPTPNGPLLGMSTKTIFFLNTYLPFLSLLLAGNSKKKERKRMQIRKKSYSQNIFLN